MKQKYAILRDDDQKKLIVREYAELDKEMMSLLCEETYPQQTIADAVKRSKQAVVDAIRTNNMYPPTVFAEAIAEAIVSLFSERGNLSAELFFDDKDLFTRDAEPVRVETEEESDEDVDVDDLLEETADVDEEYDDEDEVIKDIKSSIQVAEEDPGDIDETA
jgi:predicted DNA-binding protein YlxM (UPF0122 family)